MGQGLGLFSSTIAAKCSALFLSLSTVRNTMSRGISSLFRNSLYTSRCLFFAANSNMFLMSESTSGHWILFKYSLYNFRYTIFRRDYYGCLSLMFHFGTCLFIRQFFLFFVILQLWMISC
ncbi:LOW QUALITY PROTEIN: hypothetical protein TorRG33x02_091620 [Trema orientale]|uniref:Uncharacterized protein n=1 Tax=Trema orientale TaxID=63057 RepID=A0A2P5FB05_TREOI|nr:LOW QUALITY PROTEIN: hypothetical protein TorRG33x02_091620 [Trema orientale]